MQEYNQDTVKNDFFKYLSSLGVSRKSHKNYRSDINSFLSWITQKYNELGVYITILDDTLPFLNTDTVKDYLSFLENKNTAKKTINRRLSTLRHLSKFLIRAGLTNFSLTEGIENLRSSPAHPTADPLLRMFKDHLVSSKVTPNTIKNYLSDIKQFINWLETKKYI